MAFTTNCFITKYTFELIRKLEGLGYKEGASPLPVGRESKYDRDIHLFENKYHFRTDTCYGVKNNIDCGENEELFLALAALRDDSDKNQWFTDDTCDIWEMSEHELPSHYMQLEGHKATVEEIIEHFK